MKTSENVAKIAEALAAAQLEMGSAKFDATNPHFKTKYATLASVMETTRALARHGIAVSQGCEVVYFANSAGEPPHARAVVSTTLLHSSGEWIRGDISLRPRADDPQSVGSAFTYGRRYLLSALAGVAADEDDDANEATRPAANAQSRPAAPAHPAGKDPRNDPRYLLAKRVGVVVDAYNELGVTTPEAIIADIREIVRREITASRELTETEFAFVLDTLKARLTERHKSILVEAEEIALRCAVPLAEIASKILGRPVDANLASLPLVEKRRILEGLVALETSAQAKGVTA